MSESSLVLDDFQRTIVAIASSSEPSDRGVVRLSGQDVSSVLHNMKLSLGSVSLPGDQQVESGPPGDSDPFSGARERVVRNFDSEILHLEAPRNSSVGSDSAAFRGLVKANRSEVRIDLGDPLGWVPLSLLYWPTNQSYTGQPSAEFHLIGSQPLLRSVVDFAVQCGARAAKPGEFTLRAFLGGRLDLTQAEAVLGVIEAEERGSLNHALEQLSGNLSRPLEAMRSDALDLLADVEAGLDFVDEDIEFVTDEALILRLERMDEQLLGTWEAMKERGGGSAKPVIAIRGEPNAGKSFLMNRLVGRSAAIVADVPGTTRDVVTADALIRQRKVALVDTAGIESGRCDVERLSQQQAVRASRGAALRLWCVDSSRADFENAASQLEVIAQKEQRGRVIDLWVATKADQQRSGGLDQNSKGSDLKKHRLASAHWLPCSALTGDGIEPLEDAILRSLDSLDSEEVGSVLGTAARCKETLNQSRQCVANAIALTRTQQGHEYVAAEIRLLAESLGEVTGAVYTDDLLDRVFSRFCIGK